MVIHQGYKNTEVGVIPEDWIVSRLPDIIWFQEGPGLRAWQFTTKGLKVINVTNLQENGHLNLSNTSRYISWEEYKKMSYKHFMCDADDFVMASSGNSYCKSSLVHKNDLPLLMNTSVIRFKPKSSFSREYMIAYLKSFYFKEQIDLLITGGAQPNFGPYHLNKILIPHPKTSNEQISIASVLTNLDTLIESFEKLIAKKRVIKEGAMQDLLTGKKRLPGFEEEWKQASFELLFDIFGGFSATRDDLSHKGYCYLHYGDIHTSNKNTIDTTRDFFSIPKLTISLSKIPPSSLLKNGDIVFVDASEDDEGASKHIVVSNSSNIPFISGLHTIIARPKMTELDKSYSEYCFKTQDIKRQFKFYAAGTKVTGISKSNILKIILTYPPTLAEQTAIADILTNMDNEIAALEEKLAKYKQIRTGAMQQLLTGKIRLPMVDSPMPNQMAGI